MAQHMHMSWMAALAVVSVPDAGRAWVWFVFWQGILLVWLIIWQGIWLMWMGDCVCGVERRFLDVAVSEYEKQLAVNVSVLVCL